MRQMLVVPLVSLLLISCGPEEAVTEEEAARVAVERAAATMVVEVPLPQPDVGAVSAAVAAQVLQELDNAQRPVEERFFYPVDVNVPPPAPPTPPCPSCR